MSKAKKETITEDSKEEAVEIKATIHDLEWTDYVLALLSEDEKIKGNPTTDGLRRVFEVALGCRIISSTTNIAQSPTPDNEKRATVVHSISYRLNPGSPDPEGLNLLTVDGSADVYWGNCDKVYRNHPVAVAETRAEGRALRRALRLRKVVAAEELAQEIEDHPDGLNVNKISPNQINFIDVIAKRININVKALLTELSIESSNVYNMSHETAVLVLRELSRLQQDLDGISDKLMGYDSNWR